MILALDPGRTTGFAYRDGAAFGCGELAQEEVWRTLNSLSPIRLVVERFTYRPQQNANLEAVEVIGIVKEWARQNGVQVIWQTPAQAKHFFTDDRLRERELYVKGMRHARDATRHLLHFEDFGSGRPSRVPQLASEPRSEPGHASEDDGSVQGG